MFEPIGRKIKSAHQGGMHMERASGASWKKSNCGGNKTTAALSPELGRIRPDTGLMLSRNHAIILVMLPHYGAFRPK